MTEHVQSKQSRHFTSNLEVIKDWAQKVAVHAPSPLSHDEVHNMAEAVSNAEMVGAAMGLPKGVIEGAQSEALGKLMAARYLPKGR